VTVLRLVKSTEVEGSRQTTVTDVTHRTSNGLMRVTTRGRRVVTSDGVGEDARRRQGCRRALGPKSCGGSVESGQRAGLYGGRWTPEHDKKP
jgi:hypothetical protein